MEGTLRKMTDWTSLDYAVVDVEGNGQQPPDLVELAIVPDLGGEIGEARSWLVRPETPIAHFATRIHGLTNKDVAAAPAFADIELTRYAKALDGRRSWPTTRMWTLACSRKLPGWEPAEVFDTLKLARRLKPEQVSYRLGALVEAFSLADGLPDGLSPHRATYDTMVAARLFVYLANKAAAQPLSLEALRGEPPEGGEYGHASILF
jgi:exodeoxyribonuclease X